MLRKLIAGNWKMHGSLAEGGALAQALVERSQREAAQCCEFAIFPPAQLLVPVGEIIRSSDVLLGGQDCHPETNGACTGEISAQMLKDVGCQFVIVGHSERRSRYSETNEHVRAKATAAVGEGLTPIVCIGETRHDYATGRVLAVVEEQIKGSAPENIQVGQLAIAYEPIWAIGASKNATVDYITHVHGQVRSTLEKIFGSSTAAETRILYGGSVNPENVGSILSADHVDGVLVGRAALDATQFWSLGVGLA